MMLTKSQCLITVFLLALPLVVLFGAPSDEGPSDEPGTNPLEVRIANFRGTVGVGEKYDRDQLYAVVTNASDEAVRIWDQWNSWGYHNLTLSLELEDGETKELRRFGGQVWSQNAPDAVELRPGEHYVFAVWLMPEDRKVRTNSWGPLRVRNGDFPLATLQAHYEINDNDDAQRKGVWVGRISSRPTKLRLKDETGEIINDKP